MRAFLVLALIFLTIGCKKDNTTANITDYNWVLKAQVISPAITINGKTSTNYLSLQNPEWCSKNFTYVFYESGLFEFSSNGSLCDMIPNTKSQKWKREGDQVTLDYGNTGGTVVILKVKGNSLIHTSEITSNGEKHALVSTYLASKSK
ncbi:hypothetical protein EZ428_01760 [Pedobacter frigiditerrae]|uniref:Lipocalin-like domain-containing protein n=1 Tax=Pedobacter frigiditerrae TaxID=2530452 RepID=A0A4R0N4P9_9SPHI|nr:hypothetical protein [Pedobacter frigiditerrae]TCC93522.1 hypothetical protein EZ428_01760 [Pedobacter frigiditerrae]